MSEFFVLSSAAQAACIAVQLLITEEGDEGVYNFPFVNEMMHLSQLTFRSHFRLSKTNFEKLLKWVGL